MISHNFKCCPTLTYTTHQSNYQSITLGPWLFNNSDHGNDTKGIGELHNHTGETGPISSSSIKPGKKTKQFLIVATKAVWQTIAIDLFRLVKLLWNARFTCILLFQHCATVTLATKAVPYYKKPANRQAPDKMQHITSISSNIMVHVFFVPLFAVVSSDCLHLKSPLQTLLSLLMPYNVYLLAPALTGSFAVV